MAFRRTKAPFRKRSKWSVGLRTRKWAVQASHISDQWLRDGEDANASGVNPTVNTTNSLLLGAYGDFVQTNGTNLITGWQKADPLIKRVIFFADLSGTENANQVGVIDFQWWVMACSSTVQLDWTSGNRDPNDNTLATASSAFPHSLFKTGIVRMDSPTSGAGATRYPCRIKFDLNFQRRPYRLRKYDNLYFMIKPIIVDDQAGSWASGEVQITWNVAIKAAASINNA